LANQNIVHILKNNPDLNCDLNRIPRRPSDDHHKPDLTFA